MKKQEINTLRLIESLERNPKQTQRDLSVELNISLGLVNAFTKRLIQKGFFKIKTIPKNRIKYILTPKGMYEKTRLTYQYILHSLDFYKDTRAKMKSIYDQFSEQGKKRVFFIGASELTEIALIALKESRLELASVIDDKLVNNQIMGIMIRPCSTLKSVRTDDIIIITGSNSDTKWVYDMIHTNVITSNVIDLSN